MAAYMTIAHEMIQEQCPALHEQLCRNRTLLATVNDAAIALKRFHETWMDQLSQSKPDSDPIQIASQALELALEDLRQDLLSASEESGAAEPFSLDAAMSYVRHHTPNA